MPTQIAYYHTPELVHVPQTWEIFKINILQ